MKKFVSLMLAALWLPFAADAANMGISPLIQNVPGRQTQSLDGHWKYILDVYELGYYNYRMAEDANGWFRDQKAQNIIERLRTVWAQLRKLLDMLLQWIQK